MFFKFNLENLLVSDCISDSCLVLDAIIWVYLLGDGSHKGENGTERGSRGC